MAMTERARSLYYPAGRTRHATRRRDRPSWPARTRRSKAARSTASRFILPSPAFFFFNDTATTEIYTLSLHDALPISSLRLWERPALRPRRTHSPVTGRSRAQLWRRWWRTARHVDRLAGNVGAAGRSEAGARMKRER